MTAKDYTPPACWLTIPEFCTFCGISPSTFYRWCDSGVVPEGAVSRAKGRWPRVNASAVFPERFEVMDRGIERGRFL